jgi:cell wall assembly regulator SMI1
MKWSPAEKWLTMKRLFDRMHVWLAANAPDVLESFGPGATDEAIRAAEHEIGVTLPADVRAAYRIHNGCYQAFLYSDEWNDLEGLVRQWRVLKGLLDDGSFAPNRGISSGPIRAVWYHPAWLPISDSGFGYHFCLDMAPKARGHVGQVIRWCHDEPTRYLQARSFREWLSRFVSGLEADYWSYDEELGRWTDGP